MASVRIDDPAGMNVLGLFLAARLRSYPGECAARGALTVDAGGMRATVCFEANGATVTREQTRAKAVIAAPLPRLVRALVHPNLRTLLGIRIKGSRLFALRALQCLKP